MKYYAVKKGVKPGIYTTWDAAKENVDGFPNACYKAFTNEKDALCFLNDTPSPLADTPIAYVDGSYKESTNEYSFGAVLIMHQKEITFKKSFPADDLSKMRNVAGEIKGAAFIINYCYNHNIEKITIYHDYVGISKWYLGEWKANEVGTKKYQAFAHEMNNKIKVTFVKVKGHSNDKYNDMADRLAKDALGIK